MQAVIALTRHQFNLAYGSYMMSKFKYDRDDTDCELLVQVYHTYNRVFNSNQFMEVVIGQVQNIRFGIVGADHQNGLSESSTKTITSRGHTMMIYADMRSS